ncbi:MAG: FAD-binding protein [Ruminococcaceae bacterium]|nr:FAD-binding protein [Oscillospiraceae bacterium]
MKETIIKIGDISVKKVTLDAVIIGTGAAGYNCALRLSDYGVDDIAIITEGVNMGTSRNTGSDKQTYYKMNLCADYPDSPKAMAQDLFNGKCVDGDIAYAEAALSVMSFLHLCELGVEFPVNRYGEYVGYKTDHDPRARATSVGPLTSKMMTECLESAVQKRKIKIYDKLQIIEFIKNGDTCVGVLCLNKASQNENERFVLFNSKNTVIATGGPAGIYSNTVYPIGHHGASGVAFEAGVKGRNLTEWQYGLASTAPRWNVSGTYMQVLPRFVSVDENGNEYEFLNEYFDDIGVCLSKIFKKGYEWPFDCKKVLSGSSIIDLLVFRENVMKGRRVYLDFRKNPYGLDELPYDKLEDEAREYLENAHACFGTPLARLQFMNMPAYDLYLSKGVDLEKEMLEIALCAQHNNGGLDIDMWWQTNVPHLFACGEVAGSHGVYRPGGSALNAGQVGSTRCAQYISRHQENDAFDCDFDTLCAGAVNKHLEITRCILGGEDNVASLTDKYQRLMDEVAGPIRDASRFDSAQCEFMGAFEDFKSIVKVNSQSRLWLAYRLRDALLGEMMYIGAMKAYTMAGGKSRGSAIYTSENGTAPANMESVFRFELDDGALNDKIFEITYTGTGFGSVARPVRELPEGGGFFENIWREYRENKNIY